MYGEIKLRELSHDETFNASYPADKKSKSGKLRILYEGFPMAFLTEQVTVLYSYPFKFY